MERYIVTGAGGHLGNTVVRMLAEQKKSIRCLVLQGEDTTALHDIDCDIYFGNVTNRESLATIFDFDDAENTTVIHCAGIVNITSGQHKAVYDVNVGGTKNIADICLEKGVKKLVHVSSVHAIPEQPSDRTIAEVDEFSPERVEGVYAKTKSEATQYVLECVKKGLDATVVHPSGIIGPNDYGMSHMTQLIVDFARGRLPAGVRGGYDFVDVRDVANGILLAAEKGSAGACYILSNSYVGVPQLLGALSEVLKRKPIRVILPMWLAKLAAPFAELYYKIVRQKPLFTRYSLYTLTSNGHFSNEKAKTELGYKTRGIDATLLDTVSWLREHRRLDGEEKVRRKAKAKR